MKVPSETAFMRDLYRRRAAAYDRVTWLYRCCGFRDLRYRKAAAQALALRPGATVVDLACGTGLNFEHLQRQVGPTGRIVGVDLTDAMLERALARVRRHGWENVELVEADAADYTFPIEVDGALSTLAMSLSPRYDEIVANAAQALAPHGVLAILDLKYPERWPRWLVNLGIRLNRGYGVDLELRDRTPWLSAREHLSEMSYQEYFGGALYLLAAGTKPSAIVNAHVTSGA